MIEHYDGVYTLEDPNTKEIDSYTLFIMPFWGYTNTFLDYHDIILEHHGVDVIYKNNPIYEINIEDTD